MQGKVEICGVNTARLKVLSQKDMDKLLLQAKDGTPCVYSQKAPMSSPNTAATNPGAGDV